MLRAGGSTTSVTKVPRWAFEKLPGTTGVLGTQMQSVGEVMAIGRTVPGEPAEGVAIARAGTPRPERPIPNGRAPLRDLDDGRAAGGGGGAHARAHLPARGVAARAWTSSAIHDAWPGVDLWFLDQHAGRHRRGAHAAWQTVRRELVRPAPRWRRAKRLGFSDAQLAHLWGTVEGRSPPPARRPACFPTFKTVDTCAAEFAAETPYHYSTWEDEDEVRPSDRPRVIILGSGPNRIGQGIEFDYCCVHASFALRDAGFETVMVNCNPETVSTDYDTSDRLYFEPLTREDVHHVIAAETRAVRRDARPR